jgi:hypothetical protein
MKSGWLALSNKAFPSVITIIILLLLLWMSMLSMGCYYLLSLLHWLLNKRGHNSGMVGFGEMRQYNRVLIPLAIVLAIGGSIGYLLYNPALNFRTAYIQKKGTGYLVTVKGRYLLMAHDPISMLAKSTYIDSSQFEIPRASGIIDGREIPAEPGYYQLLPGPAIVFSQNSLRLALFYDNYDDRKTDPSAWNGEYELVWRK